jgi:hypothetical protein
VSAGRRCEREARRSDRVTSNPEVNHTRMLSQRRHRAFRRKQHGII